jgi:hypothetical protein
MSQEVRQTELQEQTQKLLRGSLKYVRVAALAAALVPLASVAAAPVVAWEQCASGCAPPPPPPPESQPGTGTTGYWKNHAEAWPVNSITVGGISYTKDAAITLLGNIGRDKTTLMFSSIVSAKLSAMIGNYSVCVDGAIGEGDDWMATYGPIGKNVLASSPAWVIGEPIQIQLDNYNNGLLCAPHRQ